MTRDLPNPRCPRCGYDLSGHTEGWEESCPLEGRCSECGLGFWWSDVYSSLWVGPRWSYEHQRVDGLDDRTARWLLARRLIQTMLMALRPRRLWREMTVVHKLNRGRLVRLAVASLAVLHALCVVLVFGSHLIFDFWSMPSIGAVAFPYGEAIRLEFGGGVGMYIPVWASLAFAAVSLSMPLAMLILRASFRRAGVRQAHLVRAAVLSLPLSWATILAIPALAAASGLGLVLGGGLTVIISQFAVFGGFLAIIAAYGLWWRIFLADYVRMAHPTLTAVVLLLLSAFFVFTMAFSISVWMR